MRKRKKIAKVQFRNNRGFTLIEVIAVLIIVAIITAVAISRATGTDEAKLQAEVDTLKGHLRYAQYLAMNDSYTSDTSDTINYQTRTQWGISIAGTNYTLVKYVAGATPTTPFNLPSESSPTHTFKSPIEATGATLVLFDSFGSPYNAADTKLTGNAPITITLSSQSITITPETGFIQ